jgi:surface antigen
MEEGEHVMPGRHRKTSDRKVVTVRVAGGVIAGAALTAAAPGSVAQAGAFHGEQRTGQTAADLAVLTPAGGALSAVAGGSPVDVAGATPGRSGPVQAAGALKLAVPGRAGTDVRQSVPQQSVPRRAAPKQAVPQQSVPKRAVVKRQASPMASAQDVINLAKKQVGIHENADGGGTKFQQWYMASPQARVTVRRDGGSISDYGNAAWCDMFVSWLGKQAGARGMGEDAYTVEHAKWFQQAGRWGQTPKPGAVVFFAWNGGGIDGIDHVGLVVKKNSDGTIQTVEGNTSNAVMIRQRPVDSVVGYGYPLYAK